MTRGSILPHGRQFVLTWGIPSEYGGLTAALLQRSRLFAERGSTPVQVLTCDDRDDRAAVAAEVERRRALAEGVRITNLWDWLRENDLRGRPVGAGSGFSPLCDDAHTRREYSGGILVRRIRTDADGAVRQIDHLRDDGTLAVSDRRDVPHSSGRPRRVIVTCDASGQPRAAWRGVRELYASWIDRLTAGERAFVLVDSKAMARFAAGYRRPGVVVVHVVHGSHLTDDGSAIRASRAEVFSRLSAFDAVVFCTARQAGDVRRQVGPAPLLAVVPHPVAPVDGVDTARHHDGVVVLARLEPIKRVEDAIDAVTRARKVATSLELDVYGDGPARPRLEGLVGDGIRLRGFDPAAREALSDASFLLMTSRSEAFSLVVAEAMAAGCLPIAYDVPYGPRELIAHGRTGWLVPAGDVQALADTLVRAASLAPDELSRMRRNAVDRTRSLDEATVLTRWAVTLSRAARRHRLREATWRFREVLRRRLRIG